MWHWTKMDYAQINHINSLIYFRRKSSLAYFPTALEDSVNWIQVTPFYTGNTILFKIKVFGRRIKETALVMYLIKLTKFLIFIILKAFSLKIHMQKIVFQRKKFFWNRWLSFKNQFKIVFLLPGTGSRKKLGIMPVWRIFIWSCQPYKSFQKQLVVKLSNQKFSVNFVKNVVLLFQIYFRVFAQYPG